MENMGLAGRDVVAFAKSVDENYKEINTEVRSWIKGDDLLDFAGLIQPSLENIVTSSAFETGMPYEAYAYYGKDFTSGYDNCGFKQIEYYTFLFYNAVAFRSRMKMPPLNIHINYYGIDFLEDLKKEKLGRDTTTYLKLMLRQQEGNVKIHLYKEFKLLTVLSTEDDLKLN